MTTNKNLTRGHQMPQCIKAFATKHDNLSSRFSPSAYMVEGEEPIPICVL